MIQQLTNGSTSRMAQLTVAGAAGSLVSAIVFTFLARPDRMFQLVEQWGPWVSLVFLGLLIFDRRMGQGVKLLRESAVVTARLTDSVATFAQAQQVQAVSMRDISEAMSRLAQKDNEQMLRQEALLDEVNDRNKRILAWIEREEDRRRA